MRLLVCSFDLPPVLRPQAIQIGRLLNYLPQRYELFAVTADDCGSAKDNDLYPDLHRRFKGRIVRAFSRARTLGYLRTLSQLTMAFPDAFFVWHRRAYHDVREAWASERFDRLVTFAFPMSTNLFGLWLKRALGIPWIAVLSDPWAGNPYLKYSRWVDGMQKRLERKVFEVADTIVVPSQEMAAMYRGRYPGLKANKLKVLHHSYDSRLYKGNVNTGRRYVVFRYIGNFYGSRSADSFLLAISNLKRKGVITADGFRFEVIGHVSRRRERAHRQIVEKNGLEDVVRFFGSVAYQTSLNLMEEADVLVLLDSVIPGSVYFPSKLADYIGARRPILGITPKAGASRRIVEMVDGWTASPDDVSDIEHALVEAIGAARTAEKGQADRVGTMEAFDIDCNVQNFAKILDACG